jgi:chaperone required for assembly of F1-ATPase
MPVTMQCCTAVDITANRRETFIAELLRYLTTDIVCFPAFVDQTENSGESLKLYTTQQTRWAKALVHFEATYGKLEVLDSHTLRMPNHPQSSLALVTQVGYRFFEFVSLKYMR